MCHFTCGKEKEFGGCARRRCSAPFCVWIGKVWSLVAWSKTPRFAWQWRCFESRIRGNFQRKPPELFAQAKNSKKKLEIVNALDKTINGPNLRIFGFFATIVTILIEVFFELLCFMVRYFVLSDCDPELERISEICLMFLKLMNSSDSCDKNLFILKLILTVLVFS